MTIFQTACAIIEKLQNHGYTAYFAGGFVRDYLMGHPSDDIDIATDATPTDIQALFLKTIPVGIQFGIIVVVENEHQFEVATFRKDCGHEDGRRPLSIELAAPEEDAKRRDFTINGMFYDPLTKTLFDYCGGQEDIKRKIIKAIGNPHERFLEDRLRMIRAVRYACRFEFSIDHDTKEAIIAHSTSLFPSVAIERVWQEFCKISRFGCFKTFLLRLHALNLLPTIFKELKDVSSEDLKERLLPIKVFPKKAPVIGKILKLFPSFSLEEKLKLCDYLKISNKEKTFVTYYHQVEKTLFLSLKNPNSISDAEWVYLYVEEDFPTCLAMALAHLKEDSRIQIFEYHKKRQEDLSSFIERIKTKNPIISSHDLLHIGINPSPIIGKLLKEAELLSINEKIEEKEALFAKLKKNSLWPKGNL